MDNVYIENSKKQILTSSPETCVGCVGSGLRACRELRDANACQVQTHLLCVLIDHVVEIALVGMKCKQEVVAADTIRTLIRLVLK